MALIVNVVLIIHLIGAGKSKIAKHSKHLFKHIIIYEEIKYIIVNYALA